MLGWAGHWQPRSVDIVLTPSAIGVLDCTGILVVAQAHHTTLLILNVYSVAPALAAQGSSLSPANKAQDSPPLSSLLSSPLFPKHIWIGFRNTIWRVS